jgi:aldose 1-epimerase
VADLRREPFGELEDGRTVDRFVVSEGPLEVGLLTWGATVHSVVVPDRNGRLADTVLGFDDLAGYLGPHPYFGATIGRYANRIAAGLFQLAGAAYQVPVNDGPNALHGGSRGFDRALWSARPVDSGVEMTLVSGDGDMGFPGRLEVSVTYTVRGSQLRIDYAARTDRPTVVNLTNHAYFNLAGAGAGSVGSHELRIAASRFLPVDATAIPTGEFAPVEATPMDFRLDKPIGRDLRDGTQQIMFGLGYDHTWVLDREAGDPPSMAARVRESSSGRVLEVWTDQPGVQFYSGNRLDGADAGKGGRTYRQGDAFCLETQHFPDSPNRPMFPPTVLNPDELFASTTIWRFSTD